MFRVLIFLVTLSLLALSITITMFNPLSIEVDLYFQKLLWEGLNFALLETSAREIPILATNIIGNKDIVASGKTGYLFETLEEFNEALALLKTPAVRQDMGLAAAKRTALLFNSCINFRKLSSIYQA